MFKVLNEVPASLRQRVDGSRFAQSLLSRGQRMMPVGGVEQRTQTPSEARFARLPEEPEDARMTGVTRSLTRRLLALNVNGTLRTKPLAH